MPEQKTDMTAADLAKLERRPHLLREALATALAKAEDADALDRAEHHASLRQTLERLKDARRSIAAGETSTEVLLALVDAVIALAEVALELPASAR